MKRNKNCPSTCFLLSTVIILMIYTYLMLVWSFLTKHLFNVTIMSSLYTSVVHVLSAYIVHVLSLHYDDAFVFYFLIPRYFSSFSNFRREVLLHSSCSHHVKKVRMNTIKKSFQALISWTNAQHGEHWPLNKVCQAIYSELKEKKTKPTSIVSFFFSLLLPVLQI